MNPSAEPAPSRLDASPDRGRRALLACLRQDLLEPLQDVVTLSDVLLHDAGHRPDDYRGDICQMQGAARGLLAFAEDTLDASRTEFQGTDFDDRLRDVRHEIGNRLNQMAGFCQLLLLREEADFFGAFLNDLEKIYELCQQCEQKLLRYRNPELAPLAAGGADASLSGIVHQVLDEIQSAPGWESATRDDLTGEVLIVDDQAISRDVLARLLRHQGHRTWEAENGRQALQMMETQAFDLVLLDLLMPEMDGFKVLQHLQARPSLCRSSILVVSGLEEVHGVVRCLEMGAEDYLNKPIDHVLLRARVTSCLEKRRLRQRELEQFFPAEVARQLIYQPQLLEKGREADVTVLCCDIRKFSRISERLGPGKTVQWVSAVMEVLSECVLGACGVVVDFAGDELMAMWGAPAEQPDHAELACRAALDMLTRLPKLNQEWEAILGEPMAFGIGINSGPAWVGNTGTRRRFKYGPLGNTVNLASRVQGATKYCKARLLITGATEGRLPDGFLVRRLSQIQAVNIEHPVNLFEVVPPGQPHWSDVKYRYESALQLFEKNQLKEAAQLLGSLIYEYGAEGPEMALMLRALDCLHEPARWSPVWVLPAK